MANKSVTITEPVANDVVLIGIRCDGAGAVTLLHGSVATTSSDGSTDHSSSFNFDVASLPAAVQTAVDSLVAECLTRFKAEHGF